MAASAVAVVLAEVLAPVFPAGISLPITLLARVPLVALAVGVVGSLAGSAGSSRPTRPSPSPEPSEMPALSVKEITVAYTSGGYTVRPLDGLSFDVADGNLALLLGPSGSGKTTLLSVLAGILTPSGGAVHLGDEIVSGLSGAALTEHRRYTVGVVFQAFNLIPSMTALENVAAPLLAAGVRRARPNAEPRSSSTGGPVASRAPPDRATCPAASSSASPSPGPWCTTRPCSSPTNRPPTSTTSRSRRCSA